MTGGGGGEMTGGGGGEMTGGGGGVSIDDGGTIDGGSVPDAGVDGGSSACAGTLWECSSVCTDLAADPENCGQCGQACASGQVCNRGVCQVLPADCTVMSAACGPGYFCDPISRACMAGCRLTADCPSGATCNSGACGCPSGQHACGQQCVSNAALTSCGASCSPCPTVANGTATCTSGMCGRTCDAGYVNSGGACVDINECNTNNGGCSASAICTNTPGSRACVCRPGFTGDGVTCSDVNECLTDNGGCHGNATCTNTPGARTCLCNIGYVGNGVTCADVDECATNNGGCHSNATCANAPGTRSCTCNSGYSGNGLTCADVNECLSNNGGCAVNATCANTPGSRSCTCDIGYSGNGVTCADVNECLVNNGGCSPNGTCTNTPGSRSCACNTGFMGDGSFCSAMAYLKAPNTGVGDAFGSAVAVSADGLTLVVGAMYESSSANTVNGDQTSNAALDSGAAYVFTRVGPTWVFQAYLKASNNAPNRTRRFGKALALSADGNTIAVGAVQEHSSGTGINGPQWVTPMAVDSGAVFIFTRAGTTWSQQAYVKASNSEQSDEFGTALALSANGNTLAVSSLESSGAVGVNGSQNDNTATNSGAVYVFSRAGTAWSQQAYVKASNTASYNRFGWSVALSGTGDTLAVGAYLEDSAATGVNGNEASNAASGSGAAYVFGRTAGVWSQRAYLKASNTQSNANFGTSIALSGDGASLAVGAPGERSSSTGVNGDQLNTTAPFSGAVYVFTLSGATWAQQAYVKASNTEADDRFGDALAMSSDGTTLAVGARFESSSAMGVGGNQADNSASESGAAYVFTRVGTTWSQSSYVKASNTQGDDEFGGSVSLSSDGRTLCVGAAYEDSNATGMNGNQLDNSLSYSGAAYVLLR